MPRSSRLRDLQRDWNQLVPIGRQFGLSVRPWGTIPAAAHVGQERLDWLRRELTLRNVDLANLGAVIPQTAPVALVGGLGSQLEPQLELLTFGAEIECILPQNIGRYRIARMLTEDLQIETRDEMLNHENRIWWKATHDGSLGHPRGCELVSPILRGADGLAQLRKVCEYLDSQNVTVSSRCGFHVHIGARNRDVNFWRNLLKLYAHFEPVLDTITAPSRRGNRNRWALSTQLKMMSYAARLEGHNNVEALLRAYGARTAASFERYEKLNLCAYWRHGTVEFRQHQGTINANKAENWVKLCLRMAQSAIEGRVAEGEQTLEGLANRISMPAAELTFFKQRASALTRIVRNERT